MAFSQSDVDALKKAMASGASMVRFADGREVSYRSIKELRDALAIAQTEVAQSSAGATNISFGAYAKD